MRILVCGGRGYANRESVYRDLDRRHGEQPISCIIHGGATGADQLAHEWARERGIAYDVYVANWKSHAKSAGPMRNQQMLDEAKPDLVVAFPGNDGTRDMCERAWAAGVPLSLVAP